MCTIASCSLLFLLFCCVLYFSYRSLAHLSSIFPAPTIDGAECANWPDLFPELSVGQTNPADSDAISVVGAVDDPISRMEPDTFSGYVCMYVVVVVVVVVVVIIIIIIIINLW